MPNDQISNLTAIETALHWRKAAIEQKFPPHWPVAKRVETVEKYKAREDQILDTLPYTMRRAYWDLVHAAEDEAIRAIEWSDSIASVGY